MCKKLVALCFVLALTSAVFADEVQINSWESGTLEGWVTNTASATLTPAATKGVTDGTMSMEITAPGMTWWSENAMIDLGTVEGGIDAFKDNRAFKIDISVFQADFTMDPAVGWTTSPSVSLLLNPGSGQWWNIGTVQLGEPAAKYGNPGADITTTAQWEYSQYLWQIMNYQGVCKLILEFTDYGYLQPVKFYADNAWLIVPEPATMALLGLGSLALLRRKK